MAPLTDAKRRIVDRLEARRHRPPRPSWPRTSASPTPPCASTSRRSRRTAWSSGRPRRHPSGRGRPPVRWQLTPLAGELFPDRHADLTVELIGSIREALGDDGLDKVIGARSTSQLAAYQQGPPRPGHDAGAGPGAPPGRHPQRRGLPRRGASTARTAASCSSSTTARCATRPAPARACAVPSSSCSRRVLGDDVTVERVQHLLSGDQRCAYRIHRACVTASEGRVRRAPARSGRRGCRATR